MEEKQVKGTMLLDYVRMIRGNKDKDWDKYLQPEDWEIINGRILSSMWYPYENFQRIGLAVFHEISGGNLETVRIYGKLYWKNLLASVYKAVLGDRNPFMCLDRFAILRGQFFSFATHEIKKIGEKHAHAVITVGEVDPGLEPYCAQLAGGFDAIMEHADAENPKIETIEKEWKGALATVFDIVWE